jgi:succinoglycan biosynthesis transport protein ExoP
MESPTENSVSPLDYLRPIWRFRWVALVMVIVASAATYAYFDGQARTYEASTQLYVGRSDINSLFGAQAANATVDARSLANQARLVTTPRVAVVVIRRLGLDTTPAALLEDISVRPDTQADFLTIVADASSARLAAQLVNGFAQGYLQVRAEQEKKLVDVQLKVARVQLARTPMNDSNVATRSALRERIQELESASLNPQAVGEQLSTAQPPHAAIAPKPGRNAVFAAALACLLAIVLAYVFDRSDRRLRSIEDMEAMFDTAILAAIPRVSPVIPGHGSRDHMIPALREPYHTLRVNLELIRSKRSDGKSLLVTSGLPGEGKSTVVRNLALAYLDAGMRVAVVDADLRRPSIAPLFDLARAPGTAEVLRGAVALKDAMQPLSADQVWATSQDRSPSTGWKPPTRQASGQLDLLAAGEGGENPGLLFYPVAVRQLFNELERHYDVVLVDTPPVLVVSDVLALAPEVDGVVVVGRIGMTTDVSVQRLLRTFEGVPQTQLMGTVVNAISVDETYTYAYYGPIGRPQEDGPSVNGAPKGSHGEATDPALQQ